MLPESPHPLSHTDLARLDHFLHTAACGRDALGLSYAHGFLTAMASGPERLEPEEWLRLLFDEPVFGDGEEAREMLGLSMRLFHEIEQGLAGGLDFRPVFEFVRDRSGGVRADARVWCRGFVSGLALFSEYWTAEARAALRTPLELIIRLAEVPGPDTTGYGQLCEALPKAAESVHHYWLRETRDRA